MPLCLACDLGSIFSFLDFCFLSLSVFFLDASFLTLIYSNPDFSFFFLAGSLVLDKAALTLWCIKFIIWDCLAWDLALNDFLFKVSTISCLVENLTLTVSDGSSSVYNLLLDPFGFLPLPFLGSLFFFLPSSKSTSFKKAEGVNIFLKQVF